MTKMEFPGPGLTAEQWEHVKALAVSLGESQASWISGYFAGLDHAARGLAGEPAFVGVASRPAAARPELPAATRTLTILYGGETGNGAALANSLASAARAGGLSPLVADMAEYKVRKLKDEQDLLVIVSTHGEGDPPQPASGFFEFVEGRKAPRLSGLRFSVLALGDSTYEKFCEAGKRLDRRFEDLGATRLRPRVDCDVDYEESAAAWSKTVLAGVRPDEPEAGERSLAQVSPSASLELAPATVIDKRHPFAATIVENLVLTGRGSSKETRHIEFSLAGSGLAFEPGDALGVVARNDPVVVEAMLGELALEASAPLKVKSQSATLGEALEQAYEITAATPRFLDHWAVLSDAAELKRLTRPEQSAERSAFLNENHVIDIIRAFRTPGIAADDLVKGLRPLQPRLYSIASSLAAAPDEAHLTVSTVRYDLNGQARSGVASGHLAERGGPDTIVPVYVQANPHFRLPDDDIPILMIGAGTGVAPYRAFMQEREARGASGRSWLVFGERQFRTDFLYQTEWQAYLKEGVLTRMDVAFSRDRSEKTYVQHRLRDHAREVFAWLEEGAHIYVCGDAAHLAPDVHEALTAVIAQQSGRGREAAEDYMRALQSDRRYQRDVY